MMIVCAHSARVRVSASALLFLFFFPSCLPICCELSINLSLSLSLRRSVNRCAVNHSFGFPFISPSSQWLKREQEEGGRKRRRRRRARSYITNTHTGYITLLEAVLEQWEVEARRLFSPSLSDSLIVLWLLLFFFSFRPPPKMDFDAWSQRSLLSVQTAFPSTSIRFHLQTVFWFCLPIFFFVSSRRTPKLFLRIAEEIFCSHFL